jgi:glycosyltransferase involved in cell wall biosynthesis
VVDDGSTDGTWDWLTVQTGILAIRQENLGKCWAVNKGFETARGKYVRFLDSDDQLSSGAIDEQYNIAGVEESDLVVSGYELIDETGNSLRKQRWITCDDFIAQQLGECDGSHYSAFLFKKDLLADIPHRPDYAYRDDRMLILEVALKSPKIAIHVGYALKHRVHGNDRLQFNSGLQQQVQNFQHLNIYKHILKRLNTRNDLNARRVSASVKILWPLAHWIAIHHPDEAVNVVKWIYELEPDFKAPEKGMLGLLYNKIGFDKTERLLRFRRKAKKTFGLK